MNRYLKVFHNYAVFSGRAEREEYFIFILCNALFSIAAITMDYALGTYIVLFSMHFIATLTPALAVSVRRLHDTGKNGKWCLIVLVPLLGIIWLLILLARPGYPGENIYGPDPREL